MAINENLYTPDCIRTFTGKYMNVFEPTQDMICIEDIAHSVSMQCRFGGHLEKFYSVAQHSINVADYFFNDKELALPALLHDASEAYLLDMPSPIKKRLPDYQKVEDHLMEVIAEKFGFEYPLHDMIKEIDKAMLESEWNAFVMMKYKKLNTVIYPSDIACEIFLKKFYDLTK